MADSMLEGIVRIAGGTGFVVTEDALVVTCAHVVEGLQVGDETQVAFHATGEIVTARLEILGETEDVAILRLDEPLPEVIKPLQLGSSMTAKDRTFYTFGFANAKTIEGMAGKCEVVGETTQNSFPVLQLRASEITTGYSGAPVWDARLRVVIGMVTSVAIQDALGKQQETAFAIPVETLRDVCPELRIQNTCPYRGLAAFTEADAAFFFGREQLITELSNKVRHQRLIAVVGPSGSGKSSVVQAGLLPKLPKDWQVIKLRPGSDPYANSEWRIANGEKPADPLIRRFVLFVDQFEELFALCTPEVQARFLEDLQALIARSAPITVILTLRADFFGHLQASPLGKHLEHALVNVLPMESADLCAAVERPAQAVGLRFEAGLVEAIMEDARQARHTLPLLQAALTQLWEQQTQGTLTYGAYKASGRVAGAIGLWAEDTYNGLTTEEQRLARRIFTRLVHCDEGDAADTRQRRTLPELLTRPDEHDALHRLLQRLADKRLLTTDEAQGVKSVEIIHDALLKEWPRLEQWLTEQRGFYLWRQRLDAQLQLWEDNGRDDGALLHGALLVEAEQWTQEQPEDLNQNEQTYITQSLVLQRREQMAREAQQRRELEQVQALAQSETRRVRNLRIGLGVAVLFLLVALGAAWIAIQQTNLAEQRLGAAHNAESTAVVEADSRATAQAETEIQHSEAVHAQATAETRRIEAENAQAAAEAERDRVEQQAQVALARQLGVQAQAIWGQLTQYPERAPRALLLAVESLRRYPESTANQVVADSLELLPREVSAIGQPYDSSTVNMVNSVAFSPDGRWVVSGGGSTALVWEAATGREVARTTYGRGTQVHAVAFSPDGQWVISGGGLGVLSGIGDTALVWEATTGREVAHVTHEGEVLAVAFSPNGQWVVSAGCDEMNSQGCIRGTALVWEAATGREVTRVTHEGSVNAVAFSPDGRWVVSAGGNTARVWEAATGREVAQMTHNWFVYAVAFSPDGQWVVSGGEDGTARVWEAATGREVTRVTHEGRVNAVAFSPDGRWVVSGSKDDTARVWQATTGREVARITHGDDVHTVAFSPDGRWVVSAGCDGIKDGRCVNGSAWVLEAATGLEVAHVTHEGWVSGVALSPDGQWVVSAGCDELAERRCILGSARVWEAATGREVARVTHESVASAVAFSPNGRWVVSGSGDGTALVWEAATGREVARVKHGDSVYAVAFSPDGQWVVSSGGNTALVWEAITGHEVARMTHKGPVFDVAFSLDGQWLARQC